MYRWFINEPYINELSIKRLEGLMRVTKGFEGLMRVTKGFEGLMQVTERVEWSPHQQQTTCRVLPILVATRQYKH